MTLGILIGLVAAYFATFAFIIFTIYEIYKLDRELTEFRRRNLDNGRRVFRDLRVDEANRRSGCHSHFPE